MIEQYLENLENRIDPDIEEALLDQWKSFCDGTFSDDIFSPQRAKPAPTDIDFGPEVLANRAIEDPELLAMEQLQICHHIQRRGSGEMMGICANYGTGTLPSIFGAEEFRMDDKYTYPGNRPLVGGRRTIEKLVEKGVPDLNQGYGGRTLSTGEYLHRLLSDYPKLSKYIWIYHPDLQGPMDVCELLWGSSLFVDLVDCPELAAAFLELITETYMRFLDEWYKRVPPKSDYSAHWAFLHKGKIMLRDDSAMNLSPVMFEEFIEPYDRKLLDYYGGGGIHFCGRGEHFMPRIGAMNGVYAVHMTQPEYNDMDIIFDHTIDKGIKLLGLDRHTAQAALTNGRDLKGNVCCLD